MKWPSGCAKVPYQRRPLSHLQALWESQVLTQNERAWDQPKEHALMKNRCNAVQVDQRDRTRRTSLSPLQVPKNAKKRVSGISKM